MWWWSSKFLDQYIKWQQMHILSLTNWCLKLFLKFFSDILILNLWSFTWQCFINIWGLVSCCHTAIGQKAAKKLPKPKGEFPLNLALVSKANLCMFFFFFLAGGGGLPHELAFTSKTRPLQSVSEYNLTCWYSCSRAIASFAICDWIQGRILYLWEPEEPEGFGIKCKV